MSGFPDLSKDKRTLEHKDQMVARNHQDKVVPFIIKDNRVN